MNLSVQKRCVTGGIEGQTNLLIELEQQSILAEMLTLWIVVVAAVSC